jgi:hypothetical protein
MKSYALLLSLILILLSTANAQAFYWNIGELNDLPHERYYTWGKNWALPENEVVTTAHITFQSIYNWTNEPNDRLWLHLLQAAPTGVHWGTDNEASGSWFTPPTYTGEQILLNEFANLPEGYDHRQDITYTFSVGEVASLNNYIEHGSNFGLGFDPDCHYYNSGITLYLETAPEQAPTTPVPEPGTLALLGFGLVGAGVIRWRRSVRG